MTRHGIGSFCLCMLIVLAYGCVCNASESDISCLRSIKDSLQDPSQVFFSWNFSNQTEGFICRFIGVECWHAGDNRVLSLRLPDMGFIGSFPMGIANCTSMGTLNLSNNQLSGPIPSNIGQVLEFVTTLDLSSNNFSGPIPPSFVNCSYLNVLRVDNNMLTGQIPPELSYLSRIKKFNISNNRLSGPVPIFRNITPTAESYANNLGLCGGPLKACKEDNPSNKPDLFIWGFVVGFAVFTILSMLFMFFCLPILLINIRYCTLLIEKNKGIKQHPVQESLQILCADDISCEEEKISAMERFVQRFSLLEVERATDHFNNKNVIGYGNMGVMYKALFPGGWPLAIKRLHKFEKFEKEFLTVLLILGRLQHTNLVPLVGFCFEREKKFLAYKYMCNGSLHDWLHCRPRPEVDAKNMGWILRFKIAVGVARGLAWLHHNVVHLKISSRCILLDEMFEPKISSFGDAEILENPSGINLVNWNYVMERGDGCYSKREDVYKFGILLVELVTGKEACEGTDVVSRAYDECLIGQGFDEELVEILRIAENCVRRSRDEVPSMLQVYKAICGIGEIEDAISAARVTGADDPCMDVYIS